MIFLRNGIVGIWVVMYPKKVFVLEISLKYYYIFLLYSQKTQLIKRIFKILINS